MAHAKWKNADSVKNCMKCEKQFSLLIRKDNCRGCGDVFCKSCLPQEIKVPGYSFPEKACSACVVKFSSNSSVPGVSSTTTPSIVQNPINATEKPQRGRLPPVDIDKVQSLCQTFQPQIMNNSTKIARATKMMIDEAQKYCPAPFNFLCGITSNLLSLAENAVVNTAEANRMADRVCRISFAILMLSKNPGNFEGSVLIVNQLLEVFNDAVALLRDFQPDAGGRSFMETIKAKMSVYSSSTVKKFADIHEELTMIMQDRMFVASVAAEQMLPPTMEQIQSGIQQEVAYVLQEIKKTETEGGTRMAHVEEQLQSVLDVLNTGSGPRKDIVLLDPRAVQIDITKILGKGASGSVFAGTLYGKTDVAVKVLLNVPPTEEALAEVKHELEYTIRVSHRNVIKVYGLLTQCSEFDGRAAVVMERLGASLDSVCGKLRPQSYMKLTTDIIAGMARVHDSEDGVVHFDLKPANIMLTPDGRTAKIVDFGVAQSKTTVAFASAADTSRARGTVAYMAPEILTGKSRGFYCDVYSFAVLVAVLWTGRRPWPGCGDQHIITAVQQGSRPFTDSELISIGVPEPVIALIVACWDHSPGNRPSFKNMLQLRDIDAFWEAPSVRWPAFLTMLPAVQSLIGGVPMTQSMMTPPSSVYGGSEKSFTYSTMSAGTTAPTAGGSGGGLVGVGYASVPYFNCEQLCLWLQDQNIDEDVIAWLKSKKITGDLLINSGVKIIQRLRDNKDIDEWNIDALERCRDKVSNLLEQEKKIQEERSAARRANESSAQMRKDEEEAARQRLVEEEERRTREAEEQKRKAEQAERAAAEAIAAARQELELKRQVAAAKAAEYNRAVAFNMQAVEGWKNVWITKNPAFVEGMYTNHYSSRWSGTLTICGKTHFGSDLNKAKEHTYLSLKDNWVFLPERFSIIEINDTFIRFEYSTRTPPNSIWTAKVRFDFDTPGVILKSDFNIDAGKP